ncbi:MAG: hypothetical protein IJ552_11680 [Prevotella sp.]|nr:hypothetical protein [Prevotella sp.]
MKKSLITSTGLSRKGAQYANKRQRQLVKCLLWLFAICMILMALTEPVSAHVGLSLATMSLIGSIDDVTDRETHGNEIAYQIVLIACDQLADRFNFPQPDKDRLVKIGKSILKPGEAAHYFEAHTIPTLLSNTEKGDVTTTGTNTFTALLGGDRTQVKNFVEEYSGYKFIILYKHIKDTVWHIIGEAERPMVLNNTETKDDADGRYTTLTFVRNSVYLDCLVDWEADESITTLLEGNPAAGNG